MQQRDQLLLAGLPEDDPIGCELALQPLERLDLRRVRQLRHVPLHPVLTRCDPVGNQVAGAGGPRRRVGQLEHQPPDVVARTPRCEGVENVGGSDIASDGMALVTVNTPLALLEIHRIARKIPVDQAVAPGMEIEPFLPNRRAGEHEGQRRALSM